MATVKLEIDTETSDRSPTFKVRAKDKVLLVSSVPLTLDMLASFTNGFRSVGDLSPPKHDAKYNNGSTTSVEAAIMAAHGPNKLIVTAGGNITYEAARNTASQHQKPFISLLGGAPQTLDNLCRGAVTLGSYESHYERFSILIDKGVPAGQIALYRNGNSAMYADEAAFWHNTFGQNQPIIDGIARGSANDPTQLAAIPGNVLGVIISADPFFQANKEAVIGVVNTWIGKATNKFAIYPSLEYGNSSNPAPAAQRSVLFGPSLPDAYELLGQLAAVVLLEKTDDFIGFWPVKDHRKNL